MLSAMFTTERLVSIRIESPFWSESMSAFEQIDNGVQLRSTSIDGDSLGDSGYFP